MSGFNYYDTEGSYAEQYPKSFIASKPFNNDFFTYTVSKNARFVTVGALGLVTTNAALCPVGRVLHATGKKLYPNVNPMNTFPAGSLLTGPKFLMSVYDPISMFTGFIDPTSQMFAKYDQVLPNSFDLGPTANTLVYGAQQAATPLGGQLGRVTVSDSVVNVAGTAIAPLNASAGRIFVNNGPTQVFTASCTASSRIFLTTDGNALAWVTNVVAGSFQITTNAGMNINWLVVN
jgi:hypothetical protein